MTTSSSTPPAAPIPVATPSLERPLADHIPLDEEPTALSARVVDRDGDVWAMYGRRWGCLTAASSSQTWSDLWHVCGPLAMASTGPSLNGDTGSAR